MESWNCKLKKNILITAINPLKKKRLFNVDFTSFEYAIPLPKTYDLNINEIKNQKIINR